MANSKPGRKPLVDEEVDLIFRKLEPFLEMELSLNKACIEAQIPKPTAYDLLKNMTKKHQLHTGRGGEN